MPHVNDNCDHKRLFDAADACLRAAGLRTYQVGGQPIERPADLLGTMIQPQCLAGFTESEIDEACDLLIRLGYLVRRGNNRISLSSWHQDRW